ncbi:Store-operated calcium entry regulator STIMATE [Labeo rohita]|uniref:Store-operated calcium entry regulator STIMATE n=1 Tax=Labeo rohita TaxID=84645 RepID=A0ABQ8M9D2_LABRO|nr:Store-operated calcium entry regulator STIMATE [Labeo rohita]
MAGVGVSVLARGQLPSASSNSSPTDPDARGCSNGDFMDSFGIFLQGLLGVKCAGQGMFVNPEMHRCTCKLTTVNLTQYFKGLKRFREPKHERRPWRIWFLDTSKQAIGMLFIHFANVYLSDLTEEDPCSLYLINFLLDATLGMLVIYGGVKAVSAVVEWRQWDSLRFGEYGEPVQCSAWAGQCALYILIMMFEKVMIMLVLLIPQWKKALMFWVVDNFLMKKGRTKAKLEEREAEDDPRGNNKVRYRRALSHDDSESEILFSADDEMEDSDGDDDVRRLTGLKPVKKKKHRLGIPV